MKWSKNDFQLLCIGTLVALVRGIVHVVLGSASSLTIGMEFLLAKRNILDSKVRSLVLSDAG